MTSILLVDDEKSIRITLNEILREAGYDITLAENGNEALQKLEEKKFNILLSDISMPGKNGLELAQTAYSADQHIKIILFTGKGTLENATEALRIGTFDYLLKPVKKQELLSSIERAEQAIKLDHLNNRLLMENQEYRKKLEQKIQQQSDQLTNLSQKLLALQDSIRDNTVKKIQKNIQAPLGRILEFLPEDSPEKLRQFRSDVENLATGPVGIFKDINPFAEENITLEQGIKSLGEIVNRKSKIPVTISELLSPENREQRKNIFLALREAILNAAQHSKTDEIRVSSTDDGERILYTVSDTGEGISEAALEKNKKPGLGMLLMRERTEMAGGLFGLKSSPQGTTVTLSISKTAF